MPKRKQPVATVRVYGPDGSHVDPGEPVPAEWSDDETFDLEHLIASGGAE